MKHSLLTITFSLLFLAANAQIPSFDWAVQLGDTSSGLFVLSTTTDHEGSVYSTGVLTGTIDFDPGAGIDTMTDHGFGDVFIFKLDSSGVFQWAKRIGEESYDQASSITVDAANNIYVTGFFSRDSTDFDPGAGTFYLPNPNGGASTFILKLDSNGNFVWAKSLGADSNSPSSIALDANENILLTGIFGGTVDFDPGSGAELLTALSADIYILKLTSNGDFIRVKQIDATTTNSKAFSIASGMSGAMYLTGLLLGTVDFDPGIGVANLSSTSQFGAEFILKLDSTGNFMWAKVINGDISQTGGDRAILVDAAENLYTAGWFDHTVDFDPNSGVNTLTVSVSEPASTYLLKLDSSGNFIRAIQIGDGADGSYRSIALDHAGNLFVAGKFLSIGDFDPGPAIDTLSIATGNRFIAKYDSSGALDWAFNFSNSNFTDDHNTCLSIDDAGNIIATGVFNGVADFDPGMGTYNLSSLSSSAFFILKLNPDNFSGIINPSASNQNIFVYPNPSAGEFRVRVNTKGALSLYSPLGQLLQTFLVNSGVEEIIFTPDLPNGVYFLKFDDDPSEIANVIILN